MMEITSDYKILLEFIDAWLPLEFKGIPDDDPLLLKINDMMAKNRQYFYFGDMLQLKIMYTSPSVRQLLGIEPEELDPGIQFALTHPDDMKRHAVSRSKMIRIANELFCCSDDDDMILSSNLRYKNAAGSYTNFLIQVYSFKSEVLKPTVYSLFVNTDIDWFGPIKHGYNFYLGNDKSYFRFPDKELILTGCIFTDREFEILKLLRDGLDSINIGEKLFLSTHTVDTHRRNILKKTGYPSTSDLIIDLQERGFF